MFVRCVKIAYKDSICQNCSYLRQKDDSSIQDDLRLSFDDGYMSNSETISFFLSWLQLKEFQYSTLIC